jgi:hypothetical protein
MTAKVHQLFRTDSVQNVLNEATEAGLTEIVLIGRRQDGSLMTRYSPVGDIFPYIGMVTVLQHDMLEASSEVAE